MRSRAARSALLAGLTGVLAVIALPDARTGAARVAGLLAGADAGAVRTYLLGFGPWAPAASFALVQVQAVIAPLPSFPLMYANGLLFGTVWGGLLSWASILVSALLCFGLARCWGRPLVERVASPVGLRWADALFARYGVLAVLVGRLIPLTAFDLLSYAAGLTPMRPVPFAIATGVGMAPAIFLTAAAGEAGGQSPWHLAAGLLGIGVLAGLSALVAPVLRRRLRPSRAAADP